MPHRNTQYTEGVAYDALGYFPQEARTGLD